MKNYKVEATMKFTDKEENTKRVPYNINLTEEENEKKGSIFYCTKERYEFLKRNSAVKLIKIIEEEKEIITEEEVQAVANAIVEQAEEDNKSIEEVVNEIVEESKEEIIATPKKKKSSKK